MLGSPVPIYLGCAALIVAGYSSDESNARLTQAGEFAALAIYSQDRLIRKAVSTAALSVAAPHDFQRGPGGRRLHTNAG